MADIHQYTVGEHVVFSGKQVLKTAPGHYEIRALLPPDSGRFRYRLKSELERFERVVSEEDLSLVKLA